MDLPLAQVLAGLRGDLAGAAFVAGSILALFASAEVIKRRTRVPTEWTRKLTHVGAGAIVLGVPWFLHSAWTVAILSLAFLGVLAAGKATGLLSSVHDVQRRTSGAYYYPLAVLGLYVLSGGDPVLYAVPLAIMAVADTGAALVGQRVGAVTYRVLDGERTLEGSVTFFGLAFTLTLAGLTLAGRPGWPEVLLVTLVVAALVTAVEAVSVRGSDNLLVPYVAWLALHRTLSLGLAGLAPWIEGMLLTGAALAASWTRAELTAAGAVTVFLVGTLAHALGGWAWWLPFACLYLLFLRARPPRRDADLDEVFATSAGSLAVVLAFAHSGSEELYLPFLATVSANGAILMAALSRRRRFLVPESALLGASFPVVPAVLLDRQVPMAPVILVGMVGLLLHALVARWPFKGRRLVASLSCGLLAWVALGRTW